MGKGREARKGGMAGRTFSRRRFLALGGAGLAGAALAGAPGIALGQTVAYTSAHDLGVRPENDGITNRENLVKALRYGRKNVTFPPGDYTIDNSTAEPGRGLNSAGYIIIDVYEGELQMQAGARFVFTDPARRGLGFYSGTGAKFHGLRSTFQTLPPKRVVPQECITFDRTTDTIVEDVDINGSAAAGLLFWQCTRPSVYRAAIKNTRADGLHFANCQDATAADVLTDNTGDDGLAFVDYANGPANTGGTATNITVKRSRARGIVSAGQSGVTVDGFTVEDTSVSGLLCAHDSHYDCRVPSDVLFKNGTVTRGGAFRGTPDWPGQEANKFGIEIDAVSPRPDAAGNPTEVEFRDVKVVSPETRGVSAVASRKVNGTPTNGIVRLTRVEAQGAGAEGYNLQGVQGGKDAQGNPNEDLVDFRNGLHTPKYYLEDLVARGTNGIGMYIAYSELAQYGRLTSENASKTSSLRRAFSFENNKSVRGTELHVVDDQATPTGYKFAHAGGDVAQSGTLGAVHDRVAYGDATEERHAGSTLTYTRGDTTAPTVDAVSPGENQAGVGVRANVWAHFSEEMDPRSLNAGTFTLVRSSTGAQVAATVSYDPASGWVVLNPANELHANTTWYRATVKGGANGAKDVAGNPLAADRVWSFRTRA